MEPHEYIKLWKFVSTEVPKQHDGYNCGVHAVLNILNFLNPIHHFGFPHCSQEKMGERRAEIAKAMLNDIYNPKTKVFIDLSDKGMGDFIFQISILT